MTRYFSFFLASIKRTISDNWSLNMRMIVVVLLGIACLNEGLARTKISFSYWSYL